MTSYDKKTKSQRERKQERRVESQEAKSMKRHGRGLVAGEPTELFNLVLSESHVQAVSGVVVSYPQEELKRSEVVRVALRIGLDEMARRKKAGASWSDIVSTVATQ
jgi:hypothetical protein